MCRRRELQERFSGAANSSRYRSSRQSTDTGIYILFIQKGNIECLQAAIYNIQND